MRVLHFVTGGMTGGATQVAVSLVKAAMESGHVQPLLVLRRKRHTDPAKVQALRDAGVNVEVVTGGLHLLTIWRLAQICRRFRPQVLVAHGFSEHLWGRYAGLLAGVPKLVHVEHNTRERYTWWRLRQAHWLARRTARIVGCSEGVRLRLLELGFDPKQCIAIPNGVRLAPFQAADTHPHEARVAGIVMAARFAKQKDQPTLLRALALLRERGLQPPLLLAGGGSSRHRRRSERLCKALGLSDQVRFLGQSNEVPQLLMTHRIAVLSTHHEGMPLSLVEGMAAGCAVVASAVPGVREMIDDGVNGRLFSYGDAKALADALEALLRDSTLSAQLGAAAREDALQHYSLDLMNQRYESLFLELAAQTAGTP